MNKNNFDLMKKWISISRNLTSWSMPFKNYEGLLHQITKITTYSKQFHIWKEQIFNVLRFPPFEGFRYWGRLKKLKSKWSLQAWQKFWFDWVTVVRQFSAFQDPTILSNRRLILQLTESQKRFFSILKLLNFERFTI